ncbi:MAG: hypothetical protein IT180_06915, partial [Acidobacteria bacterium]|nr:hypothetical protein [Acidobacteriota bacterium]
MKKLIAAAIRYARAIVVVLAVALAVVLVSVVSIDLGPALKARAERAGGNWLDRTMHIGRLGVQLGRGRFVLDDLVIDGMRPGEEPWLVAKRIEVSLTWGALFRREVLLDTIEMTDWRMVVESFPDGRQTFPRVTGPPRPPRTGPAPVVTTLQYVRAWRGEFVYRDHGTPWSAVARNLDVTLAKLTEYRGHVSFSNGTVAIQDFVPMAANLEAEFKVQGSQVIFEHMDLTTDGARSDVTGSVDMGRWPEQTYFVKSRVQFPRMRELFFAHDTFSLYGEGDFTGTFHLFKGGRELTGNFYSREAGLNVYRFPNLEGSLIWVPDRFEVTRATSGFVGGRTAFTYRMAPIGDVRRPVRSRFDVEYTDVDLRALTEVLDTEGLRVAGRATGRNRLDWPMGDFADRVGDGSVVVAPPPGMTPLGVSLPASAAGEAVTRALDLGPFSDHIPLQPVALGGRMAYSFDGEVIRLEPSEVATADTFVAFAGATAWGERSKIGFQVTSTNWQESDRLLAGLMTAFGAHTRAIPIDGVGRFDGVLLGAFRRPRIEGRFEGQAIRAWNVTWGGVDGDFVVENQYANVSRAVIVDGVSRMDVSGQFSLGFPRADGGEEIDARVRIDQRDMKDFLAAFNLQDYDVTGLVSGDFHLYGEYTQPFG